MENSQTDEWFSAFIALMHEGRQLKISPTGFSMYPFILNGRDEAVLEIPKRRLKRGDVVLYRRDCGTYVLHRIHHVKKKNRVNSYYLIGDSQHFLEGPIKEEQILALTVGLERNGKPISYHNFFYCSLIEFWLIIYRFRRIIIKCELRFQYHILHKEIPDVLKNYYM